MDGMLMIVATLLLRCVGAWRSSHQSIVAAAFHLSNSIHHRQRCRSHYHLQSSSSIVLKFTPTSRALASLSLSTTPDNVSSSTNHYYGSSAIKSIKPLPLSCNENVKLQLISFYRFIHISEPNNLRDVIFEKIEAITGSNIRGTVYVANEGINAQFAVPINDVDTLLHIFRNELPFDTFEECSPNMGSLVDSNIPTFDKLIVRTRDYILRDGLSNLQGADDDDQFNWNDAGIELDALEWDMELRQQQQKQQQQKNVQLLDCRNSYESKEGSFVSSTPLNTNTFSETWSVIDDQVASQLINPSEPVYIYCTGGIRCVKVGAYLRQRHGFNDVRRLKHGIVGYERWNTERKTEDGENNSPLWVGENFVFDKRRDISKNDK